MAQLEQASAVTDKRRRLWRAYHEAFEDFELAGLVRRPIVPDYCTANTHIYYLLVRDLAARTDLLQALNAIGIGAVFHYVPLHSSPAGRRFGRAAGELPVTVDISERLVRLPLWTGMNDRQLESVIGAITGWAARVGGLV